MTSLPVHHQGSCPGKEGKGNGTGGKESPSRVMICARVVSLLAGVAEFARPAVLLKAWCCKMPRNVGGLIGRLISAENLDRLLRALLAVALAKDATINVSRWLRMRLSHALLRFAYLIASSRVCRTSAWTGDGVLSKVRASFWR